MVIGGEVCVYTGEDDRAIAIDVSEAVTSFARASTDPNAAESYNRDCESGRRVPSRSRERCRGRRRRVGFNPRVRPAASAEIIAAADDKGCDVISMASHGRTGLAAVFLGSTAVEVLTHSHIPVLVWR